VVEATHSNDHFDAKRGVIQHLLARCFNLSAVDASALHVAAEREANCAAALFHCAQISNDRLSFPQRIARHRVVQRLGIGHAR
jgi:hypothetical protein